MVDDTTGGGVGGVKGWWWGDLGTLLVLARCSLLRSARCVKEAMNKTIAATPTTIEATSMTAVSAYTDVDDDVENDMLVDDKHATNIEHNDPRYQTNDDEAQRQVGILEFELLVLLDQPADGNVERLDSITFGVESQKDVVHRQHELSVDIRGHFGDGLGSFQCFQ